MSMITPSRPGRKRDASRDPVILDAALEVLAEDGYEGMTVEAVATRARAGKGTVYRRWPSKAHLVHDAVVWMTARDVDLGDVPDTGSLRGDIRAMTRPDAYGELRLKVITGLLSMVGSDTTGLGAAAYQASVEPWVAANRIILERAAQRGEIPASVDIDLLSRVVPSLCLYRITVERQPLDPDFNEGLIDRVLLPAVGLPAAIPMSEGGRR